MIHVLFVCLGNICRSPMAEAIMRQQAASAGLAHTIKIDSAGTGDWHIGREPHEGTRRVLDNNQVSYEGQRARQFRSADFIEYTYIICMDDNNVRDIEQWRVDKAAPSKVLTFMSLLPDELHPGVPDPYYTGNFEQVYDLIWRGCAQLLRDVMNEEIQ